MEFGPNMRALVSWKFNELGGNDTLYPYQVKVLVAEGTIKVVEGAIRIARAHLFVDGGLDNGRWDDEAIAAQLLEDMEKATEKS